MFGFIVVDGLGVALQQCIQSGQPRLFILRPVGEMQEIRQASFARTIRQRCSQQTGRYAVVMH